MDDASKFLVAILFYSILTIPFVEWPGSVLSHGLIAFVKGAIFYFFTVKLIINENRLKNVISLFVVCNLIRVAEPLVLNIATGYLGSATHLGGGEFAGRLSGAPSDIVNPNGLAFIISTIIPFLHYIYAKSSGKALCIYFFILPILLYAMVLTLSRSGVIALGIIAIGIWLKSTHRFSFFLLGAIGLWFISENLSDVQKDRYFSIVSDEARQSASAEGRIEGWVVDFNVAMNRPIVGHGLGTSKEANWNVAGKDQVSHILWAEIWQEIGLIGLSLFLFYLWSMIKNFSNAGRLVKENLKTDDFLYRCVQAMQVWLLMNFLFSFASYGLKSYEWYFFGGLSVVVLSIVRSRILSEESDSQLKPDRSSGFKLARKISRF
ncbi:O-antigen ligase family protein [Marinobacter sp. SBS5]|uniref:O-antigen ligase family protein n=1 Tax=Marinobacter sp. SBS5 TaxID=3401754 RepID=UPI003AAC148A